MFSTSERIKALRQRQNLTQGDMANELGMTRPTYASRESDESPWRIDELEQLAKFFGVQLSDLIGTGK